MDRPPLACGPVSIAELSGTVVRRAPTFLAEVFSQGAGSGLRSPA